MKCTDATSKSLYIGLSGVFDSLCHFLSPFSLTELNLLNTFLCFYPRKGINFKTGHVQIKELNDIVLAAQNQTISNRNNDDCKWVFFALSLS